MRLVLAGCEYADTTTLVNAIVKWGESAMGGTFGLHDHFKIPHLSHEKLTLDEQAGILALSPNVLKMFQRYHVDYHLSESFYSDPHHIIIGLHFDEAVYAPRYFGYGMKDVYGDRGRFYLAVEHRILKMAPDTVLVQVKANPDVIARRMKTDPYENQVVREEDIEPVLAGFEEIYERSVIPRKMALDTSTATVEETLAEFLTEFKPRLSETDRLRMLTHRQLQR